MYTLCEPSAVNTQGFVRKRLCALYKCPFVYTHVCTTLKCRLPRACGCVCVQVAEGMEYRRHEAAESCAKRV